MFTLVNSDSSSEQVRQTGFFQSQLGRPTGDIRCSLQQCRNHRKCSLLLLVFRLTRLSFKKVHFPVLSSHLPVATDFPHFLICEESAQLNTTGHVLCVSFYCGRTAVVLDCGCELSLLPDLSSTSLFPDDLELLCYEDSK